MVCEHVGLDVKKNRGADLIEFLYNDVSASSLREVEGMRERTGVGPRSKEALLLAGEEREDDLNR